ncbi:MAG TPA: hypothetical protein VN455_08810 [Methanotrichaceae archaeon]|nr:hypothetical protein [Methanotrichaceae archaeon]
MMDEQKRGSQSRLLTFGSIACFVLVVGLLGGLFLNIGPKTLWAPQDMDVAVPIHYIPAYHIITADEFTIKAVDNSSPTSKVISNISSYMNGSNYYCTLEPLKADEPVSEDKLFDLQDLTGLDRATVVGIPANSATSLGGRLQRGDVVDLVVPRSDGRAPLEVENVHVLDIRENASGNASDGFTIVAVLSRNSALQLINETRVSKATAIRAV